MEINNILSADMLDIIFDKRNKDYGAYDLRKNYQRRLTKALLVTLLLAVLVCLAYVLLGSMKPKAGIVMAGPDIILAKAPEAPQKKIELILPPQKIIVPPAGKMMRNTVPVIVKGEVPDEEKPHRNEDMDNAKIGTVNTEGKDDIGIIAPVDDRTGIAAVTKKQDDADALFTVVEIESQYPAGAAAWGAFLYRNLVYPQDAIDNEKQGTVYVQFIVDTEGHVSDVTAISGPEELRAAAIAVIRKSGKWTAAIQNGRKVKSYKKQPITFRLAPDQ